MASYISEDCLTDGKPDADKIRPMVFNLEASTYSTIGNVVARAWSVGREVGDGR
jgi:hypothetical protein